jgi:hypothetical protein
MRSQCFAIAVICLVATFILDGCSTAPRSESVLAYGERALVANAELINWLKEPNTPGSGTLRQELACWGMRARAQTS